MDSTPRRRVPRWARVLAVAGCVLMVLSGGALLVARAAIDRYAGAVHSADLFGDKAAGAPRTSDLQGPLNLLLVGIDPRDDHAAPLSDSIIVVHIPAGMDRAYLFSIPRDLLVDIPAFPQGGFRGGRAKINAAMSYGSSTGNGQHDVASGFELLARTVGNLTGIQHFDAGAIVNFGGFKKIVDAMGGVTMTIDQNVKSEHLQPGGQARPRYARCADNQCAHPYYGPQATYTVGTYHLQGWQALDYVRQRYGLPHSDYDRQRHQQQFIKAMVGQALSEDVVTSPLKLDKVLTSAGSALTFSGRGHTIVDFAFALKSIRSGSMTLIKLPGRSTFAGGQYRGEELEPGATTFFTTVTTDQVGSFITAHPDYVNRA